MEFLATHHLSVSFVLDDLSKMSWVKQIDKTLNTQYSLSYNSKA